MTQPLKIGVLGSRPAGQTLAAGLLEKGHPVMIGSRHPAKLDGWLRHAAAGRVRRQKPECR
jgi:NADPH-dependent glutamate synthase beta subunit-like oxidoreductase